MEKQIKITDTKFAGGQLGGFEAGFQGSGTQDLAKG